MNKIKNFFKSDIVSFILFNLFMNIFIVIGRIKNNVNLFDLFIMFLSLYFSNIFYNIYFDNFTKRMKGKE